MQEGCVTANISYPTHMCWGLGSSRLSTSSIKPTCMVTTPGIMRECVFVRRGGHAATESTWNAALMHAAGERSTINHAHTCERPLLGLYVRRHALHCPQLVPVSNIRQVNSTKHLPYINMNMRVCACMCDHTQCESAAVVVQWWCCKAAPESKFG